MIHARCCRTVCTVEPPIKDTPYQRHNIISFLATNDVAFQSLRRGHLSIKDKNCWSQGVLYNIEVPLYVCTLSFDIRNCGLKLTERRVARFIPDWCGMYKHTCLL